MINNKIKIEQNLLILLDPQVVLNKLYLFIYFNKNNNQIRINYSKQIIKHHL